MIGYSGPSRRERDGCREQARHRLALGKTMLLVKVKRERVAARIAIAYCFACGASGGASGGAASQGGEIARGGIVRRILSSWRIRSIREL